MEVCCRGRSCRRLIFIATVVFLLLQRVTSQHPPTCTGLQQFVTNTNQSLTTCERDALCTMVTCNTVGTIATMIRSSKVTLLSCTQPPSINLLVNGTSTVLFEGNLSSSAMIPLLQFVTSFPGVPQSVTTNVSILVTLNNSIGTEIGLEADLHTEVVDPIIPNGSDTMVINSYTRIPLDIPSCPTETPSETLNTGFVTTTSAGVAMTVGGGQGSHSVSRTVVFYLSLLLGYLLLGYLTLDTIPPR